MHFCPCLRRLNPISPEPPKVDIPLMDLSSLEGPPIDNPRLSVPRYPTNPRIHIHSPPPDTSITNILVWKPLPPAPASTDISSQQYYQRRIDGPSGSSLDPNLRRTPAHRGRRSPSPSNEIFPDYYYDQQEREMPPLTSPNIRSTSLPRRPQTCQPLVWLESEQYWVVGHKDRPRTPELQTRNRPRSTGSSPISPISSMSPYQIDSSFSPSSGRVSVDHQVDQPPPYGSHRYGSTHARLRDARISRWIDIAERRQNLPT